MNLRQKPPAYCDLEPIVERVMRDVDDRIPITTVIAVVRGCAARNRGATAEIIEKAARTELSIPDRISLTRVIDPPGSGVLHQHDTSAIKNLCQPRQIPGAR